MSSFDQPAEWEDIDSILQPDDHECEWVKVEEPSTLAAVSVALFMLVVVFGSFAFMIWTLR